MGCCPPAYTLWFRVSHTHTTLSHTTLYHFVTDNLSHTTLSHAIFHTHTTLSHTQSFTHTQLCHTHNLSHIALSKTTFSYTTLSHTTLSQTTFHTQLFHTQLFHTQLCHTHTTLHIPPSPLSYLLSPCRFNHFLWWLEDVDLWGYVSGPLFFLCSCMCLCVSVCFLYIVDINRSSPLLPRCTKATWFKASSEMRGINWATSPAQSLSHDKLRMAWFSIVMNCYAWDLGEFLYIFIYKYIYIYMIIYVCVCDCSHPHAATRTLFGHGNPLAKGWTKFIQYVTTFIRSSFKCQKRWWIQPVL